MSEPQHVSAMSVLAVGVSEVGVAAPSMSAVGVGR